MKMACPGQGNGNALVYTPLRFNPMTTTAKWLWTIPDFGVVRTSAERLAATGSEFGMGLSIGFLVTLRLNLHLDQDEHGRKWVALYFQVTGKPAPAAQVLAKFQLRIGDYQKIESCIVDLLPWKLGSRLLPQDEDVTRLPLTPEGALPIHVEVTLYNSIHPPPPCLVKSPAPATPAPVTPATILAELETRFQEKFTRQLNVDTGKVHKQPGIAAAVATVPLNVRVVSGDGRELSANKFALAVRSLLLRRRLEEGDVKQGVLRMRDMRGDALEVFLHFLHRAELKVTWKEVAILKELVMAAKKYRLKDLLEFLDEALELLATPQNCGDLILLANAAGLKKARGALLDKYRDLWKQAAQNPELMGKLLK